MISIFPDWRLRRIGISTHTVNAFSELFYIAIILEKTQNYPALETDWRTMLNMMMASQYELKLQGEMGMLYDWHKRLQQIGTRDHILCLMPETVIY